MIANIPFDEKNEQILRLVPGHIGIVDCGFSIIVPQDWEPHVSASFNLSQKGIQASIALDSKFKVFLYNTGKEIVNIKHGDRFALISIKPVNYFAWDVVE